MELYSEEEAREIIDNIVDLCDHATEAYDKLDKLLGYPKFYENLEKLENVYEIINSLHGIRKYVPTLKKKVPTKKLLMEQCITILIELEYFKKVIEIKNGEQYNEIEKLALQKKRYTHIITKIEKKYNEVQPFLKSEEDIQLHLPLHPNEVYVSNQYLFQWLYGVHTEDAKKILNRLLNPDASDRKYFNKYNELSEAKLKMTTSSKRMLIKLRDEYKQRYKETKNKKYKDWQKLVTSLITRNSL